MGDCSSVFTTDVVASNAGVTTTWSQTEAVTPYTYEVGSLDEIYVKQTSEKPKFGKSPFWAYRQARYRYLLHKPQRRAHSK